MTEEQSYQNQTGQVAPTAQNPQTGSTQPYQQQTGEQLQTSTNKLLEGQSDVVLVLPTGTSAVAPSGTTVAQSHNSSSGLEWNALVWPLLVLVTTILIVTILMKAIFDDEEEQTTVSIEDNDKPDVAKVIQVESAPSEKAKSSTKAKKSTKRKKKKK